MFGNLDTLESAYLRYANQQLFRYVAVRVQTDINAKDFAARPVSPAEATGLRASVHTAMRRGADAQAMIAASRKADPRSPASYAAEAVGLDGAGKRDEARAAYAKAVEFELKNFYVYYRLAALNWRADADAELRASLEKWVRQSIALNDAYMPAYLFLAETQAAANPAAAVDTASKAVGLKPRAAAPRLSLARALMRSSRPDVARAHARAALGLAGSDEEKKEAQALLDAIERAAARP